MSEYVCLLFTVFAFPYTKVHKYQLSVTAVTSHGSVQSVASTIRPLTRRRGGGGFFGGFIHVYRRVLKRSVISNIKYV